MRLQRIMAVVFVLITLAQLNAQAKSYAELKELYTNKQYFQLRDALLNYRNDSSVELLFYKGAVSNKFNQLRQSTKYLQDYLKKAGAEKDTVLVRESYELLADNYLKTYQYRKAAEAYETILTKFRGGLSEKEVAGYENSLQLWKALGDAPAQTIKFNGESRIKTTKNRVGLTDFPVEINGQQVALIFDTGANLSVVTTSYANKLGMKIIDATIDVGSITGNKVKARLGVANEIKLGNVTVRNVVFLVFDDQSLYISQVKYQINAIIGFPLIAALREITFSRTGEVLIPAKPGTGYKQNMCLEDLDPLIEGEFRNRRLIFAFDTGATRSDLYPPFYKAFEEEIKSGSTSRVDKTTGAGGSREVNVYSVKNVEMKFSDRAAQFPELRVHTEYTNEKSRYFYGNLGQDLIKQFETMTLNFESMSITFK